MGTRITVVTGDHDLPDTTKPGERYGPEDLRAHGVMVAAFESLAQFEVEVCTDHSRLFDALRARPPDLVVNFCDTGFNNIPTQELVIPSQLELLGIPYTGAPASAMVLCYDKQIVRLVADAMGVAVPKEAFLPGASDEALPGFYPALIKPNRADGSVGITKDAVVRDADQARSYLEWLRGLLPGADALIQEYLPGTEYSVGLIGNPGRDLHCLPILEVDFSRLPKGLAPILSYESKALPDSPYWTEIGFKRAELGPTVEAGMTADCRGLFARFGLRDYARFDYRCDADGVPKLMEVNPNPAWEDGAKLAIMSGMAGLDYAGVLRMIVEAALARIGRRN